MKVFTISGGQVTAGAKVSTLHLKGAMVDIPAIIVGEEGRGRQLGVLPIQLDNIQMKDWQDNRSVVLECAEVGQTKAGKPKLIASGSENSEKIIVIFLTPMGFRGGNSHTGDVCGWKCPGCEASGEGAVPETCPKCGASGSWDGPKVVFGKFPGEIISRGIIAEGDAGRMGNGDQLVAIIPKNTVFRTGYSGRMYGAPKAHYYFFNGQELLSATQEERAASDIF
jgi:hypothetical protein